MIPTIPMNARSPTSDIGFAAISWSSPSSTKRAAKARTRRPFSPMRSFAASMPERVSSIGTCEPVIGPPESVQRASTTSGPPLTSWITRSVPFTEYRWKVAMNL